jgi:hypothetical protein
VGCLLWRETMRLDLQGVLVRNHFRSYRFGWPEISRMADGASRKGNWELNVVLASGRVVKAGATNWATKVADPEMLTALAEAAGWHGTPAALTGMAIEHGLYADPGGQRGVRYWSGTWSPLLPAEVFADKEKLRKFPVEVASELPGADGSWTYAAARARKLTVWFTCLATLALLTLTAAIVIDPKYYSPLRWLVQPQPLSDVRFGILFVAAVFGWLASLVWSVRMQMSKVDRAARTAAVTGTTNTSVLDGSAP